MEKSHEGHKKNTKEPGLATKGTSIIRVPLEKKSSKKMGKK